MAPHIPDDLGVTAERLTRMVTARATYQGDWRELVSQVYLRLRKVREDGLPDAFFVRATEYAIREYIRNDSVCSKWYRKNGFVPHQFGKGKDGRCASRMVRDYRYERFSNPTTRMLEFWGETKGQRVPYQLRTRIMMYLRAVEGWTNKEVGEVFGVSESYVSLVITQFTKDVSDPDEK